ncbi:hypothetical protein PGTUg99_000400 [Puccinia graminis f. sp. tritici]|uniref:Uncharacterized protein n=1 Tax=Puccinia graminis f. sp. tritici TaxID=56615 RepID=A0A5B0SII5_PUCGR|nr:hypothetical protein PGTUg99_000400 [Puccinia graminis f. sp. tritici]
MAEETRANQFPPEEETPLLANQAEQSSTGQLPLARMRPSCLRPINVQSIRSPVFSRPIGFRPTERAWSGLQSSRSGFGSSRMGHCAPLTKPEYSHSIHSSNRSRSSASIKV